MRAVFIFLLSLYLFMLTGYEAVHAGVNNNHKHATVQTISKLLNPHSNRTKPYSPTVKHTSGIEKEANIVIIENDEDDLVYGQKNIVQIKYLIVLVYAAIFGFFVAEIKCRIPLRTYLSYIASPKYILQGVLRI